MMASLGRAALATGQLGVAPSEALVLASLWKLPAGAAGAPGLPQCPGPSSRGRLGSAGPLVRPRRGPAPNGKAGPGPAFQ